MAVNRILLVSEDGYTIRKLRAAFEADQFKVLLAQSNREAWDLCRRKIPHVVVLDISPAEDDQYEFLRQLRSAPRTKYIHVTILTEQRARREKIAGLKMGADDYIVKPFDVDEVRLRIGNALRQTKKGGLVDFVTGLPGSQSIREQMRGLVGRKDDWVLLRLVIRHLDEFADARGFLAGSDVLRALASALAEAVTEVGSDQDFIGHSGSEEFVVITNGHTASALTAFFPQKFAEISSSLHTPREQAQGYVSLLRADGTEKHMPLLRLDIRTVSAADGPFMDIVELAGAVE